jgi:arylsulfatase A-like enzyme
MVFNKLQYSKRPNIILISADTLRADHLGCYGYNINTSPHIDKFSKDAVLFLNAKSNAYWTVPSHLSLFTSLYPSVFKVWERQKNIGMLDSSYLTLAKILKKHGYGTAAFTSGGYVSKDYGFAHSFDVYNDDIASKNTKHITEKIINLGTEWIKEQKGNFFLFLHTYETHAPYLPPMPFIEEFVVKYTPISHLTEKHCLIGLEYSKIGKDAKHWFEKTRDENFLKTVVALYDGEIKYLDSIISRLLSKLKRLGVYDNSIVIFLSDHGEAFYEHGSFGHGNLYEETIRVPLIIHLPKALERYSGNTIDKIVSLVDVLPTILDICSISYQPKQFQGRTLLDLIKNRANSQRNFSFSEGSEVKAICSSRYKYIVYDLGEQNEREELYDLSVDPKENRNLLGVLADDTEIKKTHQRLRKLLLTQVKRNAALYKKMKKGIRQKTEIILNKDTKEQLRALGYMQ